MLKISLHQLKFHGNHGSYGEEKIVGAEFEVSLDVSFTETVPVVTHLHETVNYVTLYNMVSARMQQTTSLIETIAMELGQQVREKFPQVNEINISIRKLNPPIFNFQGSSGVTYYKKYDS